MFKTHKISNNSIISVTFILFAIVGIINPNIIFASYTYEYSGSNFNNSSFYPITAGHLNIAITTDTIFKPNIDISPYPLVMTMSDLQHSITSTDPGVYSYIGLHIGADGLPLQWSIRMRSPSDVNPYYYMSSVIGWSYIPNKTRVVTDWVSVNGFATIGAIDDAIPNKWTVVENTVTTPIPAAAWLMGSGLVGMVGFKRRQAGRKFSCRTF